LRLGLGLVLAEGLVDDRPDDVVVLHLGLSGIALTLFKKIKTFYFKNEKI